MATHYELTARAEPLAHEDVVTSYKDAPTRTVSAGGVNFAYRELGPKTGVPVIFLTHLAAVLANRSTSSGVSVHCSASSSWGMATIPALSGHL